MKFREYLNSNFECFFSFISSANPACSYLVGAGLADPDGVLVEPFVFVAEPTESRDGLEGVTVVTRRVGMRDVPSSVKFSLALRRKFSQRFLNSPLLLSDKFDP